MRWKRKIESYLIKQRENCLEPKLRVTNSGQVYYDVTK